MTSIFHPSIYVLMSNPHSCSPLSQQADSDSGSIISNLPDSDVELENDCDETRLDFTPPTNAGISDYKIVHICITMTHLPC
jgi:hypothetical protein